MRKLLFLFTQTSLWALLMKKIVPYIRFSVYYTSLEGRKFTEGYRKLKPGHIILCRDRRKLTTMLIPGYWSHAAFCVAKKGPRGNGSALPEYEIAEMTHTDFTKSWFFDICKTSDDVLILECTDFDNDYKREVIKLAKSFEHCSYDLSFDLNAKALYCSELVYQADFQRRIKVNLEDVAGIGQKYISPDGLSKAKNLKVVWDSRI